MTENINTLCLPLIIRENALFVRSIYIFYIIIMVVQGIRQESFLFDIPDYAAFFFYQLPKSREVS